MKSYTDLEQSKKLAEILPIETSDMHYIAFVNDVSQTVDYYETPNVTTDYIGESDIPCWSLAALFDLLPEGTNISRPTPLDNSDYSCWNQDDEIYADNPVDACYEMIIKLHKICYNYVG